MKKPTSKADLRAEAKRMRAGAAQMYALEAAEKAAKHGLQMFSSFNKGAIIAGYWPIGDELDPRFLMLSLEQAGYRIALPVVSEENAPLTFRLWGQGDPLEKGALGTMQPVTDAPEVTPNALLAPLLAFDEDCYRLGWGGGYYDRTLAAHTEIKAFGFAYGAQFVENLPRSEFDWPMQGIITEEGVILPRKKVM
ncbi:5-formyltetrahydrofolate cyclo-ligase [Kordiimonas sp. SCSIO 12603]|uniref:5-formyltetrahydrofolate cyclo-ligase n=1 Tax=Kordiimonas sp. SCSIO 12603 TaxID=2829596 RepID=UPI0021070743|nr:5-formyltetrahydrofolate cyclo-ligase [Kordiimonas sp. SCSIO 12603]UTW59687.1 5-formyltetrahydrofolate cyclo-ligase [Kordiimonas sp. SCSIO 12603]